MTVNGWFQILFFLERSFAMTPLIGGYMAKVFTRQRTWLDPVMRPLEAARLPDDRRDENHETGGRVCHGAAPVQHRVAAGSLFRERSWAAAVQPAGFGAVAPDLAFTYRRSFTTNTNWQAYSGESTMSYFTQMAGLAYHNFVSAAVGMAVAIAFIRAIAQQEKETIGNFWVDMVRATLWVLLPTIVGALFLVSQGVVQNFKPYDTVQTVEGAKQTIAQGPVASRRSSSSSAPMAAASSTPTARTRSRTRRRSRTGWRCSASSSSRQG